MKTILLLPLILLSACATVTASKEQTISVTTTPAGAHCSLSNGENAVEIEKTPGDAVVRRAYEPLLVVCSRAGVGKANTTLEAKTRGRAYGNILLLGVPALVDAKTGAGYEYTPDTVDLTLKK